MAVGTEDEALAITVTTQAVDLLGGSDVLRFRVSTPLDAHEMLMQGMPCAALISLMENVPFLNTADVVDEAVGISMRTVQRFKADPRRSLSQEQGGRVWKFAEILAKATAILGSQEDAEQWLRQPAMGLEQKRPIDLLTTAVGVEIVEDFLTRMEYGVYA